MEGLKEKRKNKKRIQERENVNITQRKGGKRKRKEIIKEGKTGNNYNLAREGEKDRN